MSSDDQAFHHGGRLRHQPPAGPEDGAAAGGAQPRPVGSPPVVTLTVGALAAGMLIIGGALFAAARLDAAARVLSLASAAVAAVAVIMAAGVLLRRLIVPARRPSRPVGVAAAMGLLVAASLVLAGAGGMATVSGPQAVEGMSARMALGADGRRLVQAQVTMAQLPSHAAVTVSLTGVGPGVRTVLASAVERAGQDGTVVVDLIADAGDATSIEFAASTPERSCRGVLAVTSAGADVGTLTCRRK